MLFPRSPLRVDMQLQPKWLLHVSISLLFAVVAMAQSKTPIPTLTTDDVVGLRPTASPPVASDKKSEAEKSVTKVAGADKSGSAPDDAKKRAEKDWNDRLKAAQRKRGDLERRADQTELQISQLRNQLFSAAARAPEAQGQISVRMNELQGQLNALRSDVQVARQEEEKILEEGRSSSFQIAGTVLTNEKGEANANAYQDEHKKLQGDLRDAQARIEVLQLRLNTVQAETQRKGNGDNFTLNQLRAERERVASEIEQTRTRIAELNTKIQTLSQKANSLGITLH